MTTKFWRGRRVFVTGHTGFKGAWLCMLLRRLGAEVTGFALQPPTSPSLYELAAVDDLVQSIIADVRDLGRLSKAISKSEPDVLIHMAAQSVVLDSLQNPVETYSVNVLGTVNVLEAVRRLSRPLSVVNVTTDKCYANQSWLWAYRENDAIGGRDPYSSSKACSELVAQAYRHSFFPIDEYDRHGVAIACARAGNVIGGGDWTPHQLVPSIIAAVLRREPVQLRHPHAVRPWQHVLECLSGYLALAEALAIDPVRSTGEWNFGPSAEDVVTVAEIADTLAGAWNVKPAWQSIKSERIHEELELRLDSSKARRLLNWRARLGTSEGLSWVVDWHKATQAGTTAREACLDQIEAYLALEGRPLLDPRSD